MTFENTTLQGITAGTPEKGKFCVGLTNLATMRGDRALPARPFTQNGLVPLPFALRTGNASTVAQTTARAIATNLQKANYGYGGNVPTLPPSRTSMNGSNWYVSFEVTTPAYDTYAVWVARAATDPRPLDRHVNGVLTYANDTCVTGTLDGLHATSYILDIYTLMPGTRHFRYKQRSFVAPHGVSFAVTQHSAARIVTIPPRWRALPCAQLAARS